MAFPWESKDPWRWRLTLTRHKAPWNNHNIIKHGKMTVFHVPKLVSKAKSSLHKKGM